MVPISRVYGGGSALENRAFSAQIRAFLQPIWAFSGLIGTNSSAPHSHGVRAEIATKGPFLAQICAFRAKPLFAKPPLDFQEYPNFTEPSFSTSCAKERSASKTQKLLCCNRPVPLQSRENSKPQKCILKSETCHFGL